MSFFSPLDRNTHNSKLLNKKKKENIGKIDQKKIKEYKNSVKNDAD